MINSVFIYNNSSSKNQRIIKNGSRVRRISVTTYQNSEGLAQINRRFWRIIWKRQRISEDKDSTRGLDPH